MFENIAKFFKKLVKSEQQETIHSKDTAKERLHLVLMQDRANVSADFLELMKQEIIEVIKKYIDVEEESIDVRLTNKVQEDGTNGAPFLYANIPIIKIKNEANEINSESEKKSEPEETKEEEPKEIENKEKLEEKEVKIEDSEGEEKHKEDVKEQVEEENQEKEKDIKEIKKEQTKEVEQKDEKEDKVIEKKETKPSQKTNKNSKK